MVMWCDVMWCDVLPLFIVDAGKVSVDDSVVRTQVQGAQIRGNGPTKIVQNVNFENEKQKT
jgi:hypothetical protein